MWNKVSCLRKQHDGRDQARATDLQIGSPTLKCKPLDHYASLLTYHIIRNAIISQAYCEHKLDSGYFRKLVKLSNVIGTSGIWLSTKRFSVVLIPKRFGKIWYFLVLRKPLLVRYCLFWCGCCLLSLESFVLRYLVIVTPRNYRKNSIIYTATSHFMR